MLKFVWFKLLQDTPINLFRNLFSNPRGGSLALKAKKSKKRQKISKKLEKIKFYQKIDKVCDIKKLKNYSVTIKSLSVIFYPTL